MRKGVAAILGLAALAACASAPPSDAPAWYGEATQDAGAGYPSLRDVPRTTVANTDMAYWEAMKADLMAAGEALRSHPRAAPAVLSDESAAFVEQARQELEAARQAHDPN